MTKSGMWFKTAVDEILEDLGNLRRLQSIGVRGIHLLSHQPDVFDVLSSSGFTLSTKNGGSVSKNDVVDSAIAAKQELEDGFPLFYWQNTITLWSIVESGIHRFLVDLLESEPKALGCQQIGRIKVRVAEYEPLSQRDRYSLLISKLESELGAETKAGVNRFESLLEVFGLGGSVSQEVKQDLFELQQVRNNLAHRHGRVDATLLERCPWLTYERGERLKVSPKQFEKYMLAVLTYVGGLILRVIKKYHPQQGV